MDYNSARWIDKNISSVEVRNALFNIGGLKVPRVDGFQPFSTKSIGTYSLMKLLIWLSLLSFLAKFLVALTIL